MWSVESLECVPLAIFIFDHEFRYIFGLKGTSLDHWEMNDSVGLFLVLHHGGS